MESPEILSLLDQLDDEIDDLEDSLGSVLKAPLSTISSTFPVLDKAKLYTLVTYAIEAILFSYLKLNSVDAREHAVFNELIRVKHYFDKIRTTESPAGQPSVSIDKEAAKRFIKAGLSGNNTMIPNQVNRQVKGTSPSHLKLSQEQHFDKIQKPPRAKSEAPIPPDFDLAPEENHKSKSMTTSKKRKFGS